MGVTVRSLAVRRTEDPDEEQRGCGLAEGTLESFPTGDCRQLRLDGHVGDLAASLSWQLQDCSQWVTSPDSHCVLRVEQPVTVRESRLGLTQHLRW